MRRKVVYIELNSVMNDRWFVDKTELCVGESEYTIQ